MVRFFSTLLILLIFSVGLLLLSGGSALAITQHDHVTYYVNTGEILTAAWDAVDTATSYEMQLLRFEWDNEIVQEWIGITETSQIFTTPKSGMYIIRVRARNADGVSEWAVSINTEFATVDGEPRSWWVYGYMASPGPIEINSGDDPQGGGP